jgi:hypothetical protein
MIRTTFIAAFAVALFGSFQATAKSSCPSGYVTCDQFCNQCRRGKIASDGRDVLNFANHNVLRALPQDV